jgi:V/A-type H+-transporting ATPase subunit I
MTIAPMRKLALCGLAREKEAVIAGLQALGCVHLVPLREAGPLEPPDARHRRRADAAWRHLDDAPRRLRPWPAGRDFDLDGAIDAALANKERLRTLADRRDFLASRVEALRAFGDFALPPLSELRGRRLWFYVLPIRERRALQGVGLPWAIVGRTATELHVAVIAEEEPPAHILPVPRTHTGSHRLARVEQELAETEIEIERAEAERAELTRHRLALGLRLARAADDDDRRAAGAMTRDENRLFALAGWAPADAAERLTRFAEARGLALTLAPPEREDTPPTLLRTPEGYESAAALTRFYMTPGYRSWDPSLR